MKNFKMFLQLMKGNRLIFLGALLAMNLSILFSAAIPMAIKNTIDSVIGDKPFALPEWLKATIFAAGGREMLSRNLWIPALTLILLTAGHAVFLYYKSIWTAIASQNSGKYIREHVFNHLLQLPHGFHVKSQTGDLIQRCTSDIEQIQDFVSSQFIEITNSILTFVYVFIIMMCIDVKFTMVSICLIPLIFFFTFRYYKKFKTVIKSKEEVEGRMLSLIQENLMGARVVRAFGAQGIEIEKLKKKNMEHRGQKFRMFYFMSNLWATSDFLCLMQVSLVILVGVYWTSAGYVTLGTFVAFNTYASMLIWPVRRMGQLMSSVSQALVSVNRLRHILDSKPESERDGMKPEIKGNIEFKNVYFEYEKDKPVLKDISFEIKSGQTVAFLGTTGSGKSSLVELLIRLYDYQKGSIRIDGAELKDIDKKWIRSKIGIVLQEAFLFSKSIKDNIAMGGTGKNYEDVQDAAMTADVHSNIEEFEDGYDTLIGERGVALSGGQRQRVSIARTLLKKPSVLVFDDSLSAVDMETDASIRRAIKQKCKGTTTIIISHRITTISEADVIFVIEKGTIKQAGTHDELIHREGLYQRIWKIQNSLEEELAQIV